MENGIYTRMEMQIIVYEIPGTDNVIVILNNDRMPGEPMIISESKARGFVTSLLDSIEKATTKES